MVADIFYTVLTLSTINLILTIVLTAIAHRPVIKNSSMLTKISSQMETNGMAECWHCHHIVARYFIDGSGKHTCANCKPEGWLDAVKKKSLNER